jgi:sensor histidine kinase YesM
LLIVIFSIANIIIQEEDDGPSIFSSLRAFRLFKLFKLFKVGDLRILIDSIAFTLTTISDYVILLLLFIFVFALMGMSFFAGKIKFDEETDQVDLVNGVSPRTNFDTLDWAIITIFEVLMGESWNDIMYQVIRSMNGVAGLYFIMLVVGGNIIMLNLFLAILLGNFDKARNFQQKKKVFEAFGEIIFGGRTLNEALDAVLGDMSIHVKLKILKMD